MQPVSHDRPLTVLGVDPGSVCTGYGVVQIERGRLRALGFGCIRCASSTPLADRLKTIHGELTLVLKSYPVDIVAVESLFYRANVRSALILGHVRGVALLAASQAGLPVHEYSPMEVKLAVTGYGRAEKPQLQTMIRALLNLHEARMGADASDALAVAVCHAHSHKLVMAGQHG